MKVKFSIGVGLATGKVVEIIDLIEDYGMTEEECNELTEADLEELYSDWMHTHLEGGFIVLGEENEGKSV